MRSSTMGEDIAQRFAGGHFSPTQAAMSPARDFVHFHAIVRHHLHDTG